MLLTWYQDIAEALNQNISMSLQADDSVGVVVIRPGDAKKAREARIKKQAESGDYVETVIAGDREKGGMSTTTKVAAGGLAIGVATGVCSVM